MNDFGPWIVGMVFILFVLVVFYVRYMFMLLNAVHYATSPHTHCGRFIHAVNGELQVQHTTIPENVTCWECRWKLRNERT